MIPLASGVQVWLSTGHTDMRKGFDGLALLVQEILKRNPHNGHLFVFRGRRGGVIKVLWDSRQGNGSVAKRGGARAFRVAVTRSWRRRGTSGNNHAGTARLSSRRNRLALASTHVASTGGG